jgi:hypothetical protein
MNKQEKKIMTLNTLPHFGTLDLSLVEAGSPTWVGICKIDTSKHGRDG